jgi:N-methylhydantoinase A
MIEIGAGGGSIAFVDALGLLKVGPESAASEPGPVCYGRGGLEPTVTDADLVLGYLNPNYFLGGKMTLDAEAAKNALHHKIGQKLGVSAIDAAIGVHRIVNENMANAARVHIIEKGLDPRNYSMMAFGGAGPIHAFQVARLLGSPRLIIPVGAGVVSALGFLVSPIASEQIRSYVSGLEQIDWEILNTLLVEMEEEGIAFLIEAGQDPSTAIVSRVVDMRYSGQGHEISVPVPNGNLNYESISVIEDNFIKEYSQKYGRTIDDIGLEAVTWRVVVSGLSPQVIPEQVVSIAKNDLMIVKENREILLPNETDFVSVPVYNRYLLEKGFEFVGPCIIEEMESTIVVGRNSSVVVDELKNIVIELL